MKKKNNEIIHFKYSYCTWSELFQRFIFINIFYSVVSKTMTYIACTQQVLFDKVFNTCMKLNSGGMLWRGGFCDNFREN